MAKKKKQPALKRPKPETDFVRYPLEVHPLDPSKERGERKVPMSSKIRRDLKERLLAAYARGGYASTSAMVEEAIELFLQAVEPA